MSQRERGEAWQGTCGGTAGQQLHPRVLVHLVKHVQLHPRVLVQQVQRVQRVQRVQLVQLQLRVFWHPAAAQVHDRRAHAGAC